MTMTIRAVASAAPPNILTTEEMANALSHKFSSKLLQMLYKLGVKRRRSILSNYLDVLRFGVDPEWSAHGTALAANAATHCLSNADCHPANVGVVIGVTSTPSRLVPGLVS